MGASAREERARIKARMEAAVTKNPESDANEACASALGDMMGMIQVVMSVRVGILEQFVRAAYESMDGKQWAKAMEHMNKLTLADVLPPPKQPNAKKN